MRGKSHDNEEQPGAGEGAREGGRKERLKLKLRENLKRRKAQARERARTSDALSGGDPASPDGQVGKRGG